MVSSSATGIMATTGLSTTFRVTIAYTPNGRSGSIPPSPFSLVNAFTRAVSCFACSSWPAILPTYSTYARRSVTDFSRTSTAGPASSFAAAGPAPRMTAAVNTNADRIAFLRTQGPETPNYTRGGRGRCHHFAGPGASPYNGGCHPGRQGERDEPEDVGRAVHRRDRPPG